jgi:hypothetical protein
MKNRTSITAAANRFDTALISALPNFAVSLFDKAAAVSIAIIIVTVDTDCALVFP